MCMQYWPPALDKKEVYGDIYIGIDKEEQLANFHIRTFRIWKVNLDVSALNWTFELCVTKCFFFRKLMCEFVLSISFIAYLIAATHSYYTPRTWFPKNVASCSFTTPNGIRTRVLSRMPCSSFGVAWDPSLGTWSMRTAPLGRCWCIAS